MLKIILNGEKYEAPDGSTPRTLLAYFGIAAENAIVVLNAVSLADDELDRPLKENDSLDVLRAAGGG